jgi:hypothetical protein
VPEPTTITLREDKRLVPEHLRPPQHPTSPAWPPLVADPPAHHPCQPLRLETVQSRLTGSRPGAGPSGSQATRPSPRRSSAAASSPSASTAPASCSFDPETRELLRTRPSPLSYDQATQLRGARPAGRPPRPSFEPVRVQRRVSNTGFIMVACQGVALGRIHAHTTVTVSVADTTLTRNS